MNWVSRDSALLAWVGITALIAAYVVAYDWWALDTNHKTMTQGVRDTLLSAWGGPIIAGLWLGVFVALTFHFLVNGR